MRTDVTDSKVTLGTCTNSQRYEDDHIFHFCSVILISRARRLIIDPCFTRGGSKIPNVSFRNVKHALHYYTCDVIGGNQSAWTQEGVIKTDSDDWCTWPIFAIGAYLPSR
ncbi:hypothetical protein NQ318_014418, partial [Aromia moschata]